MRAVCVSLDGERGSKAGWLTLHREYVVLAISADPVSGIEFRILADDGRTPILADSRLFAANEQSFPTFWVGRVTEGGVVELGPPEWLKRGYWESFFDQDPEAIATFHRVVERTDV